ncbi:MAG: recombination mediator RecR [Mollicutes bacterium]|nr:recombination mediator RecR [Mollicutes bacterium]MDD7264590.1 recombination mediator RecR [bacterium]MDY4979854.1 recombination mediator RecR [Candidatus Onthovivens sp.]
MKELKSIIDLTNSFKKFPSVGSKSAERMAYALLDMDKSEIDEIINAIENVSTKVHQCPICGVLTENNICSICEDKNRNHSTCIVVSHSKDVLAFEEIGTYHGVYHVLNGEISAYHGVTPKDLRISELLDRIDKEDIKEIIIATNPNIEGDTTALYLAEILKNKNVKVSRIGFGMPIGGQLDYTDSYTLKKSLENRTSIKEEK